MRRALAGRWAPDTADAQDGGAISLALTVLGSSGSYCGPGRACSGYLLDDGTTKVLVDAGNGSTANLQRHLAWTELDAVVVSHRHADHCIDLVGAYYQLRFGPEGPMKMPLFAAEEVMDTLVGAVSNDTALVFPEVFQHTRVRGGQTLEIGSLRFEFFDSVHPVPTVSMRITGGGRTLTYSGDSAGGPMLEEAARGADLFLCEATWQGRADDWPPDMHLVASDAGALAQRAGVDRLVVTHVAGGFGIDRAREEAAGTFTGRLSMAEDNERYVV